MKRMILVMLTLCVMQGAQALIVSVDGYGEISTEGMNISLTEAEMDPLTEQYVMELKGNILANSSALTVHISRSALLMDDEFCCGDNCTAGNGELQETKLFTLGGLATWFAHFTPAGDTDETITYVFDDGSETRTLHVRFVYAAQAVGEVKTDESAATKILRDGQLFIRHNGHMFSITGIR